MKSHLIDRLKRLGIVLPTENEKVTLDLNQLRSKAAEELHACASVAAAKFPPGTWAILSQLFVNETVTEDPQTKDALRFLETYGFAQVWAKMLNTQNRVMTITDQAIDLIRVSKQ